MEHFGSQSEAAKAALSAIDLIGSFQPIDAGTMGDVLSRVPPGERNQLKNLLSRWNGERDLKTTPTIDAFSVQQQIAAALGVSGDNLVEAIATREERELIDLDSQRRTDFLTKNRARLNRLDNEIVR